MKKYIKLAFVFLMIGIGCGIFYREFSKAYALANEYTTLGLAHTHFLVLGVAFVILFGLVADKLNGRDDSLFKAAFLTYIVGVSGAGGMLVVRGITDVLVKSEKAVFQLSSGGNGAIAGVSGIFHAVLGIGFILIFVAWLRKIKKQEREQQGGTI